MENVGNSESIEQYNTEAPLVGGIRFDPQRIKDRHNGKLITLGESGAPIKIEVGRDIINIELIMNPEIHFTAALKNDKRKKTLVMFDIRTKKRATEEKAPDFYAKELVDVSMKYFGNKNNIDGIESIWYADGDNYRKYFELKEKVLAELNKTQTYLKKAEVEAQKCAALGTWTGTKIAQSHGFSEANVKETNEPGTLLNSKPVPMIIVRFVKKSS